MPKPKAVSNGKVKLNSTKDGAFWVDANRVVFSEESRGNMDRIRRMFEEARKSLVPPVDNSSLEQHD
jgi:hypothetical protein